MFVYNYI